MWLVARLMDMLPFFRARDSDAAAMPAPTTETATASATAVVVEASRTETVSANDRAPPRRVFPPSRQAPTLPSLLQLPHSHRLADNTSEATVSSKKRKVSISSAPPRILSQAAPSQPRPASNSGVQSVNMSNVDEDDARDEGLIAASDTSVSAAINNQSSADDDWVTSEQHAAFEGEPDHPQTFSKQPNEQTSIPIKF